VVHRASPTEENGSSFCYISPVAAAPTKQALALTREPKLLSHAFGQRERVFETLGASANLPFQPLCKRRKLAPGTGAITP
jgi:hypothetical protein